MERITKSMKKGFAGLKKSWVNSTLADIKRLGLPSPDSEYGFSRGLLKNCLSDQDWDKFCGWMYGQTCTVDKNLGVIYFTYDVIRGLDYIRHHRNTYFD